MKVNAKYAGPKLTTSKLKNMASYGFCENEIEKIKETFNILFLFCFADTSKLIPLILQCLFGPSLKTPA